MPPDRRAEGRLAGRTRGAHRRENPAAGRVQLLVGGAGSAQRELLHTIAREARVRVAVDEPRHRAEPATVELLRVADARVEVAHPPHRLDPALTAEDVCVLDHLDGAQVAAAERRAGAPRRRHLRQVADEQGPSGGGAGHSRGCGCIGGSKPCSRANSIASTYPASTWRMTPVPGSVVSTRSRRSAISSVPSATTTIPACCE